MMALKFNPRAVVPMLALACVLPAAASNCIDESAVEFQGAESAPVPPAEPRVELQSMVRDAISRSNSVGAAKLLAEAAVSDVQEVKAGALPQVALTGSVGGQGSTAYGVSEGAGGQVRGGLSISAPLFDGGRINQLTSWRTQLAESARQGMLSTQEQIAFQAVSLALERGRYRLQAQVYQQYARKMSCLVEALGQIVAADKGRASELVQARKTQQQAQLSYLQAQSNVRQMEARLRRFVGDGLPVGQGFSSVLTRLPAMDEVLAQTERAADIVALGAQANAAEALARAVVAAQKPQVNWSVSGTKALGTGNPSGWSAGVNVNVPLYNAAADPQADAAKKRADAVRLQKADALEARRARVIDVHEQASSAFDRAHRIVDVLRDSDRVRNFTLQQWQQLGKRSLFDVMAAEGDHYNLRISYVNALYDGQQANALLWSLGGGIYNWLQ
ncbi:TolC family protein [Ideonella sp. BN130291]|uniref:TolC family protein n=1 Tax=Ideonella sp. BN130291 TaxID=3112940 RepID=UPI002E26847D|nr:TolC family protein [Ideonella sp. BN130291]